jgi:hypothetical protein
LGEAITAIETLVAKHEIHEALLRYLRGVDRCDAELIRSAFHPDAVDEHAGEVWTGTTVGEKVVARVRKDYTGTLHVIGNQLIEIDGDTAHSETYVVCYLSCNDNRGEFIVTRLLRYVDQFELRDRTWKIVYRKVIREWDRIDRLTERPEYRAYFDPERSHDDLSYLRPLKTARGGRG